MGEFDPERGGPDGMDRPLSSWGLVWTGAGMLIAGVVFLVVGGPIGWLLAPAGVLMVLFGVRELKATRGKGLHPGRWFGGRDDEP